MKSTHAKPETLLFDLGGVIVPWLGFEALSKITQMTAQDIAHRFTQNPVLKAYEIGQCSDQEFISETLRAFNLDMTEAELKRLWCDGVKRPYPGIYEMLDTLRKTYKTACLSNTNALHWAHLKTYLDPDVHFDHPMASHIMGLAKPDLNIYLAAIKDIGVNPSNIWFFDDTLQNVEAARLVGMRTFHIDKAVVSFPH